MICGFAAAVVAGFLLTAVKNWTGVQTVRGIGPVTLVAGATVRVLAPLLAESRYAIWIAGSQMLWVAAFSLFLVIYYPMFIGPRVDGQPG